MLWSPVIRKDLAFLGGNPRICSNHMKSLVLYYR
jgi:hypothetical protein